MAVTSHNTTFEDMEGTPTLVSYGGGQGAAINTDVIIEGAQSVGRRVDNTTAKGQGVTVTPAIDMSGAGVHVKVWLFVTQWPAVTKVVCRVGSGSNDDHTLATEGYPPLGGFVPIWVDVSRTPETGGAANEAAINEIGVLLDIGDVGGNASNLIIDEILYTSGEGANNAGLEWTGLGGAMSDFRTFESTNNEGNLVTLNGVDFCYSALVIGDPDSVTQTTFTDSGFTVIFPDQTLVSETFMKVQLYGGVAGNDIDLSDCTFQSSKPATASRRPNFTSNSGAETGAVNLTNVNLIGFQQVIIGSSTLYNGGIVDCVEMTTGSGANTNIQNVTFRTRAASGVACHSLGQPIFNSSSNIHDCDFVQAGLGHAFLITQPGDLTLTNIGFSGYGANGTNDAAIHVDRSNVMDANHQEDSAMTNTIGVLDGGLDWRSSQSFTGTGANVTTVAVYVQKNGSGSIGGSGNMELRLYAHSGTFGTSSVPTGAALATATAVSIASIPSGNSWVIFTFPTPYTTTNTTNYVLETTMTGNISGLPDDLTMLSTAASTHGGNAASYNGSTWSANSSRDWAFSVFSDANASITINISGGNSPTIRTEGTIVTVANAKVLTLTNIPTGVQVTLVNSSTRAELQNSTSTGADITYSHSGGETIDILLMSNSYDPNVSDVYDLTLPSADSSIKFNLLDDLNYENP